MSNSNKLQANSWREAIYYADKLQEILHVAGQYRGYSKFKGARLIEKATQVEEANDALNQSIENWANVTRNQSDVDAIIDKISNNFYKEMQLPEDSFLWLKKSYRACGFCVSLFAQHSTSRKRSHGTESFLTSSLIDLGNAPEISRVAENDKFNCNAFSSRRKISSRSFITAPSEIRVPWPEERYFTGQKLRYRLVKRAFRESNIAVDEQENLLKVIKELWTKCYSSEKHKKFSRWLERKNEEQIESCIKYLTNNREGFQLPWEPIDSEESYLALIAYFDYQLLMHPAETELVIHKMKAAWNQRKFREKSGGKRPYSISMTDRTKKRLTWLVKQEDSNISEVIKELIDRRYEQLK